MSHAIKEAVLSENHEYSQKDIAEKLFLHVNSIGNIEKRAIEKFKQELAKRNINVKDILP